MDFDLITNATLQQLKCGFTQDENNYICLFCGQRIEKGIIYPLDGVFYEAEKYMGLHIEKVHGSVFDCLINLDKKFTGLSDHQNKLLKLFYQEKGDAEIQAEMGIGSSSTVRNHRFGLKEKERQARVFLVLMELLQDKLRSRSPSLPETKNATAGHYQVTSREKEKILQKYFPNGSGGQLKTINMKEKSRLVILAAIAEGFTIDRIYTEKEINAILKKVHSDYSTLRRYLVDYGFLMRKADGSQYWLKDSNITEGISMDHRRELKQKYKDLKQEGGVYQIRNKENQKVLVVATPNFRTMNGMPFQLQTGGYINSELQEDWNKFGPDAFEFEVLEVLEEPQEGFFDKKEALKKLEQKWLETLQPFKDRGYNKNKINFK